MLLGAWAKPALDARHILDVGTGSGVLALMAAQRAHADARVDAIDVEQAACVQAASNVAGSPWPDRISVYHMSECAGCHSHVIHARWCGRAHACTVPSFSQARVRLAVCLSLDIVLYRRGSARTRLLVCLCVCLCRRYRSARHAATQEWRGPKGHVTPIISGHCTIKGHVALASAR